MDRETLEKLDAVLNQLELIHTFSLEAKASLSKLEAINKLSMESINTLDEIVPRPLPTYEKNSD